jgi:hypothetical protein
MDAKDNDPAARPPPRRGRVPLGLLGMLGAIAAAELWVQAHPRTCMPAEHWDCWMSARAAAGAARGCGVLGFGDSMIKLSVVPRPIASRTGRDAYNLGICGSQPITGYLLLRRALAAGARPSAVLVSYSTPAMQHPPENSVDQWSMLLGFWDCAEMARMARDPDLFAALLLRRTLATVRERHYLRARVRDALGGREDRGHQVLSRFVRNWASNAGAQVMPCNPLLRSYPLDVGGFLKEWYDRKPWHPVNATYLRRFLALADAHGIAVYWLQTPALPSVQAACERGGAAGEQTARLRGLLGRHANLAVIDGRGAGYEPGAFMDPNHLGREGAYAYSMELAELLRASPSGAAPASRWVELPPYRARPVDPSLEQVELPVPAVAVSPRAAGRR